MKTIYLSGDVKGMEVLVDLTKNGEPVIGNGGNSTFLVESFIDEVIDYHNNLENEMPTKCVVFYFHETDNITVVRKTVDLLKRKEKEVKMHSYERNRFYLNSVDSNVKSLLFISLIFRFGYVLQSPRV